MTSATPQTQTTSYLTTDTLGSPRVITDQSGNVTSRRDFMPFGEEIANLGGRTAANGYQADSTRQKFTSYERDTESDLDFAQARMYSSKLGRFTSVDPLLNSGNVSEPQSFNRYAYALNNPLNIIDPSGEKGEIAITVDKENKTGVITVTASFAIYAKGGKFTPQDFKREADKFEKQVRDSFNPSNGFVKDGITYTVKANLTFTTATSETDAASKGKDNIVGLVNATSFKEYHDPKNPTDVQGKAYQIEGESFDRIVIATQGGDPNTGGHETGHSFGGGGHLEDGVLPSSKIIPGIMSTRGPSTTYMAYEDFTHIFATPLRNHNAGRIVTERVQSSARSYSIEKQIYPNSSSKTYRAPAVYNRNVVP